MDKFKPGDIVRYKDDDWFTNGYYTQGYHKIINKRDNPYGEAYTLERMDKTIGLSYNHWEHAERLVLKEEKNETFFIVFNEMVGVEEEKKVYSPSYSSLEEAEKELKELVAKPDAWDFQEDEELYIVKVVKKYKTEINVNAVEIDNV